MKVEFEIVKPDPGSCFRLLYQKASADDFVWQYHYHPEYELVNVVDGIGLRHVGSHLSRYENGDLVLIGSNLPHSGFGLKATDPHEEIVIQIKGDYLLKPFAGMAEMDHIRHMLDLSKYGIAFYGTTRTDVSRQMEAMMGKNPFDRYMAVLNIFQTLASSEEFYLLNNQALLLPAFTKHRARLQKVLTYVEDHYAEDIDIRKVSSIAGLSVPAFCNYFKKTTHITFTDLVNKFRIQKACLLLHQDKTISEVCFESGFNNVTYFNKVFKNIVHKTPSEFRKDMSES